jgi:hypothetical protein
MKQKTPQSVVRPSGFPLVKYLYIIATITINTNKYIRLDMLKPDVSVLGSDFAGAGFVVDE